MSTETVNTIITQYLIHIFEFGLQDINLDHKDHTFL